MSALPALRAQPLERGGQPVPLRAAAPRRHLRAVPPLSDTPAVEPAIPAPAPGFVRALTVRAFEVLSGQRSTQQLGPLVSVALARRISVMRAVWNDRRLVYRDARVRTARATSVRINRISPSIAEASVVLHVGERACAVALRLEWVHRHWRACELIVL